MPQPSVTARSRMVSLVLLVLGMLLPTACAGHADRIAEPLPVARPALPALGVNVHLEDMTDNQRHTQFARLAALGATWVRIGAPWYAIQPTPGTTSAAELAELDRIVADARSLALHVLFIGDQAPDWAGGGSATASNAAAYADYLATLAQHFKGRGPDGTSPAYELMNEPDGGQPDGKPWATPTQYATAGCAAFHAIKNQDPRATVLAGSLDVTDWSSWLHQALGAGLAGCFDALSVHPYADLSVLNDIRATAQSAGIPNVDIWVTEFGYPTCTAVLSGCVSQTDQAQQLVHRLQQLGQSYPFVPVAMIYEAGDEPDNPGAAKEKSFGLFTSTGTGKPSVAALRALYQTSPHR